MGGKLLSIFSFSAFIAGVSLIHRCISTCNDNEIIASKCNDKCNDRDIVARKQYIW